MKDFIEFLEENIEEENIELNAKGAIGPEVGKDDDDEEAAAPASGSVPTLGAAASTACSSAAPNSWPSCVPGSPAVGSSEAGCLGSLGALPFLGALFRSWATVIRHSPGM